MQLCKTWMFLAMADFAADDLPLAAEESRKSIAIMERVYGPHGHPQLAEFDAVLLEILVAQHKLPEAEEFGRQSVTSFRRILTPQTPRLSAVLSGQGWALYRDGKSDQAVPLLREALSIDTIAFGPDLDQTARTGIRLAACLLASGKQQEARELVRKYRAQLLASPDETYHEERAWLKAHASANEPSLAL
jgi:tetratricopeptide (TPR) repeat protein